MPPLSGLQRDVMSLYRSFLRVAHLKGCVPYCRVEFRTQCGLASRFDFKLIEYMLRKGHKQLKLYKTSNVSFVEGVSGGQAS